jgi:hypothetical protein
MTEVIESGVGTVNYGKQSAKGVVATAATTTVGYDQPKHQAGGLQAKKTLGSEEFTDGSRFASASQFTDMIGGEVGDLTIQAQPENAGLYGAQLLGVDTVTGSSDPWTHTITSAGTSGAWATWWLKVGANVGPNRELYSDSKIAKLVMNCSDKQNVVHYAMSIQSCNPAQVYAVDPAKAQAATDPYYWTETSGAITFDGKVNSDVSEEIVEIDTGLKPYWGNDIRPAQLIEGKGKIISTLKTLVTNEGREEYLKALYGEVAPAAGKQPVKAVFYASAKTVYEKSATRKMTIERPRIAVDPANMEIAPKPEGGEIEISFGGECLKEGGTPALTLIVLSGEEKSYA